MPIESRVVAHSDLGSGVLDAMVETACTVVEKSPVSNPCVPFFRLLTVQEREDELLHQIHRFTEGACGDRTFCVPQTQLLKLPGCPFVYWIDDGVTTKLAAREPIEPVGCEIRVGLQTGKDYRFLRLWWEVSSYEVFGSRSANSEEVRAKMLEQVRSRGGWCYSRVT